MRILIRTDMGKHHGMGHAVRMLALARQLAAAGAEVSFVTRTPELQGYVAPFRCYMPDETAPTTRGDVLVIDTKAADWANDDSALYLARDTGMQIVRIDHPQATPDSCDLLIGPCAHWHEATVARLQRSFGDRFLYGWNYVMLDPRVTELPPVPRTGSRVRPIVFTAGGSDPTGALQRMYDLSATCQTTGPLVFLVGAQAPMVKTLPRHNRGSTFLVTSFTRHWIQHAGVVVTLFGVTCYEALWWQVPQLIFSTTQEHHTDALWFEHVVHGCVADEMACGSAVFAGAFEAFTAEDFCLELQEMCMYANEVSGYSTVEGFDGLGLQRITQAILALA